MNKSMLFIVEGQRPDEIFLNKLLESYGFIDQFNTFIVGTNIYQLYHKMKREHFELDIKEAIKEIPDTIGDKSLLDQDYTYTYLIYDCDPHDIYCEKQREEKIDIQSFVMDNLGRLAEMANHFNNETDPTIGRLYINFPMIESYRDCEEFFDERYCNKQIATDQLRIYKQIVGETRIGKLDIKTYSKKSFNDLIRMNVYKLNSILSGRWEKPSYEEYLEESEQSALIEKQRDSVTLWNTISVLNTSLFFPLDYYGNKNSFYDITVK